VHSVATLTLKHFPDDLHAALKQRAEQRRRSMNAEAIDIIGQALRRYDAIGVEDKLTVFRQLRERARDVWATPSEIDAARRSGRI
jgi:plasmid stability protein